MNKDNIYVGSFDEIYEYFSSIVADNELEDIYVTHPVDIQKIKGIAKSRGEKFNENVKYKLPYSGRLINVLNEIKKNQVIYGNHLGIIPCVYGCKNKSGDMVIEGSPKYVSIVE